MTAAAFPDRSSGMMMAMSTSRIHPSSAAETATTTQPLPPPPLPLPLPLPLPPLPPRRAGGRALHHTVWKRSSMGFPGTDGFSVYDAAGALAFRVDNYSRRRKVFAGELLLMDGQGAPLLALRPQVRLQRFHFDRINLHVRSIQRHRLAMVSSLACNMGPAGLPFFSLFSLL
jgi:hypothetical protein